MAGQGSGSRSSTLPGLQGEIDGSCLWYAPEAVRNLDIGSVVAFHCNNRPLDGWAD